MRVKRTTLALIGVPVLAAVVLGGLALALRKTTVPPLTPSAQKSIGARRARTLACQYRLHAPFTGIATNPLIGAHVKSFEQATGSHLQIVEYYNSFSTKFQSWEAKQVIALGALPFIQLNPRHVRLTAIAAGKYDAQIRTYADAVRAFRCTVMISFGHEMNGWWYPWGRPDTTPATFIAAWRHIYRIFARQHVLNVIWSWDPTHQYNFKVASLASEWYPGNAYVDIVGIDGYLGKGQNFKEIFAPQLANIRSVTSKPVFLAETGVAGGIHQARQIANLFASLRSYHLSGLVWFDLNRKQPWRLEGRPTALAAYRKAIKGLS